MTHALKSSFVDLNRQSIYAQIALVRKSPFPDSRPKVCPGLYGLAGMALLMLAGGCNGNGVQNELEGEGGRSSQFGDPYDIVGNFSPSDPELTPLLMGDTLLVRMTYPGGCADHGFDMDYSVAQDTAKLWLRHDANGDDCEAMLNDEFQAQVPEDALEAPVVVLLDPSGGAPHILRWGP
jgi:hypothetical protein